MRGLIDSERIDCLCSGRHCSLASLSQRRPDIGTPEDQSASELIASTAQPALCRVAGSDQLTTFQYHVRSRFHASQSCQLSESVGVGESLQISLGHQGTIGAKCMSQPHQRPIRPVSSAQYQSPSANRVSSPPGVVKFRRVRWHSHTRALQRKVQD